MSLSTVEACVGLHLGILGVILAIGLPLIPAGNSVGIGFGLLAWLGGLAFLASAWLDARRGV